MQFRSTVSSAGRWTAFFFFFLLGLTPFCAQYIALAKRSRTFPAFVATVFETNELMAL